jgi:hypothetical protein
MEKPGGFRDVVVGCHVGTIHSAAEYLKIQIRNNALVFVVRRAKCNPMFASRGGNQSVCEFQARRQRKFLYVDNRAVANCRSHRKLLETKIP